MSRRLHVRLDAAARAHRGAIPQHDVQLDPDGTPCPIVRWGRLYAYSHDELTSEGDLLWAVFADRGPAPALAA